MLSSSYARRAAFCALARTLPACGSTTDRVLRPARSEQGRMGFGVSSTTQAQLGGSSTAYRTGVAGASAGKAEILAHLGIRTEALPRGRA